MSDGWIPLDPALAEHLCRERAVRAVKRVAGSNELIWIDFPFYGEPNTIATLLRRHPPTTITWWMDDSGDRSARIVRLESRRHVVELYDSSGFGVLEIPGRGDDDQVLNDAERDVLGRSTVTLSQIIGGEIAAESYSRMWLDRGAIGRDFRVRPMPEGITWAEDGRTGLARKDNSALKVEQVLRRVSHAQSVSLGTARPLGLLDRGRAEGASVAERSSYSIRTRGSCGADRNKC